MIKNRQLRLVLILISAAMMDCVVPIYISITISTLFSYIYHVVHLQVSTPSVKSGGNKDIKLKAMEQCLRMTAGGEGSVLGTGKIINLHGAIKLPSFKVQIWHLIYIENTEELI